MKNQIVLLVKILN